MPPKKNLWGAKIFAGIFLLVGLGVIGIGLRLLWQSERSKDWPIVEGVVTAAEMKSHSGDNHSMTYSAKVSYRYTVAGTVHTGDKLSFGTMSSSSAYAQEILSRYPVGRSVTVHYDLADASRAVLETGIHGGVWICLGVGTAFALFAVMMLQMFRRSALGDGASLSANAGSTTDRPPIVMGVLFLLAGIPPFFVTPSAGTPRWIVYVAGLGFIFAGLLILTYKSGKENITKVFSWLMALCILALFHWVSFGPGERQGTVSGTFISSHTTNVRSPFAAFTVFFDVIIVACLIYNFTRRKKL